MTWRILLMFVLVAMQFIFNVHVHIKQLRTGDPLSRQRWYLLFLQETFTSIDDYYSWISWILPFSVLHSEFQMIQYSKSSGKIIRNLQFNSFFQSPCVFTSTVINYEFEHSCWYWNFWIFFSFRFFFFFSRSYLWQKAKNPKTVLIHLYVHLIDKSIFRIWANGIH